MELSHEIVGCRGVVAQIIFSKLGRCLVASTIDALGEGIILVRLLGGTGSKPRKANKEVRFDALVIRL